MEYVDPDLRIMNQEGKITNQKRKGGKFTVCGSRCSGLEDLEISSQF